MTLKSSARLYLTIFLMTTCIYMVLYQYHISRTQILPDASTEIKVDSKFHSKDFRLVNRQQLGHEQQSQQQEQLQQHKQQSQYEQQQKVEPEKIEYSLETLDNTRTVAPSSSTSTKSLSTSTTTSIKNALVNTKINFCFCVPFEPLRTWLFRIFDNSPSLCIYTRFPYESIMLCPFCLLRLQIYQFALGHTNFAKVSPTLHGRTSADLPRRVGPTLAIFMIGITCRCAASMSARKTFVSFIFH